MRWHGGASDPEFWLAKKSQTSKRHSFTGVFLPPSCGSSVRTTVDNRDHFLAPVRQGWPLEQLEGLDRHADKAYTSPHLTAGGRINNNVHLPTMSRSRGTYCSYLLGKHRALMQPATWVNGRKDVRARSHLPKFRYHREAWQGTGT